MTGCPKLSIVFALLLVAVAANGCSTAPTQRTDVWPELSALPESPPEDLNKEAPSAMLRPGSDGFVYAVGLGEDAEPGAAFVARYSGEWPIRDVSRPALAAGRLVRTYGGGVGLVHLSYELPEAEVEGLEVNWETEGIDDHLGKGRALVDAVGEQRSRSLTLSIGSQHGVRDGDFYAILAAPTGSAEADAGDVDATQLQLTRRLTGVCMVQEVEDSSARCTLWPGSRLHPRFEPPKKGQEAIFLEHTFGAAPRQGVIQVAAVSGAKEGTKAQEKIAEAMRAYLQSVTEPKAGVSTIDVALDATTDDFYAEADKVEPLEKPQLVIGSSLRDVDGTQHLFVTYTGVGAATGPGMVAAPPERGVDLGPVDAIDETRLQNFAATVWSGMLVYRGQTSEALIQLHQMLADPKLAGPLRWHARDQYAMRWAALKHYREALWLVLQDEAVATKKNDRQAWLNALGTRVRLYDFLDSPARAVSSARRYLDAREDEKPGPAWRSAVAMYGEMLMNAERVEDALATVEQLEEACPEGCNGDLNSHVAGIFWSVPEDRPEVQSQLLDFLIEHVDEDDASQLAATRLYQGLMAMRGEDHTQALVAFLEAERLYSKSKNISGQSRAKYFAFLAELSRGNPQEAFDIARQAQKLEMQLNDFAASAMIFERMSALYTNPEFLEQPGPYLGAARQVLSGAVEANIAMGDFGGASEALLSLGGFMLKIGQDDPARDALTEAVGYAISFKRFDVAAMAHLYLGVVARRQGDMAVFKDEIEKAQVMATLSDDPMIKQAIEQVLNPKQDDDVPTQLL
jgi:tetratricopeptide (TPR) repeat protein